MSCLFVHDFRSYSIKNEVYTSNLSYEIWKDRYIKYFGKVYILNRFGVMSDKDSAKKYVKASGPNVEFIGKVGIFTPISFIKNFNRYKRIVNNYVDDSEYIIIRLDSFLGLIAAKRCRIMKKNYLVEVVGCVWDSFWNKGIVGKIVAFPLFKIMQAEVKNAPFVVYVTEKFLQERYPTKGKFTNISNVLLPKHEEMVLKNRLNRIQHVFENNDTIQIVTVANVSVRYKGQESVIKALGELKKIGKLNFVYHLIGDGNQTYLKKIVNRYDVVDNVVFHGSMNHDNVISFLDKCDIYIQPSKQEGLPRALIEGMSRGMLCYGTAVAGIPELLDEDSLFSKRRDNHIQIAKLLSNITKDLYICKARRNFLKAQEYETDILNERRNVFFTQFRDQGKGKYKRV